MIDIGIRQLGITYSLLSGVAFLEVCILMLLVGVPVI